MLTSPPAGRSTLGALVGALILSAGCSQYVRGSEDYVPADLDDALVTLDSLLSEEHRAQIREGKLTPRDMHMGLGMGLRNGWGLWQGSRLAWWFHWRGIHHPDDMSAIILTSYVRYLRGEPVKIEEQIADCQTYWKQRKAARGR